MTPRRQFLAVLVLGLGFLTVFRLLEPTNYQIGLLMRCMILMIVTIGLNVLIGHAGWSHLDRRRSTASVPMWRPGSR